MAHNPSDSDIRKCVDAYVAECGIATRAAKRVGFSDRKVRTALRTPLGQEYLVGRTAELLEQHHVDGARVVCEAAALAFADITQTLAQTRTCDQLAALPAHERAAVSEVQFDDSGNVRRLTLHPKLLALQLLASYLGMTGSSAPADSPAGKSELGGLTIICPCGTGRDRIPRPKGLLERLLSYLWRLSLSKTLLNSPRSGGDPAWRALCFIVATAPL